MKSIFCTAILICAALPAYSLSCLAPQLGTEVNNAIASEDTYTLAFGNLKATEPVISPYDKLKQGKPMEPTRTKAVITGATVGRKGLVDLSAPLTAEVELSCIADWCGGFPRAAENLLMFLKKEDGEWVLSIPACSSSYFRNVSDVEIATISKCIRRGKCSASMEKRLNNFSDGRH